MSDLKVQNGHLVRSSDSTSPDEKDHNAVPDVTYVTVNVKVRAFSIYRSQNANSSNSE